MSGYKVKKAVGIVCKVICIGILFYMSAYPFLQAAFYTLPLNDDFSNASMMRELISENGYILAALGTAKEIYMTWQGTYTGNIILYMANVFDNAGVVGIRVFAVLNLILFLYAIAFLLYSILKYIFKIHDWFEIGIITGIVYLCFFWTRLHHDFFYFHTASCMYTIPLAFAMLSVGIFIKSVVEEKRISNFKMAVCIMFGILACGGSLQIPAVVCCTYLIFVIWSFLYDKDKLGSCLMVFGIMVLAALVNALAPGNFVRQTSMVRTNMDIIFIALAIKNAIWLTWNELKFLFSDTYYAFFMIISFLYLYNKIPVLKNRFMYNPVMVLGVCIVGISVTNFPLTLGHGNTYMDNRNYSCLDLFVILGSIFFILSLITFLRDRKNIRIESKDIMITVVILIAVLACYQGIYPIEATMSSYCRKQLSSGEIELNVQYWERTMEYLATSEEKDVVLAPPDYYQSILPTLDLRESAEHWVNKAVALYYNKDSIYLEKK